MIAEKIHSWQRMSDVIFWLRTKEVLLDHIFHFSSVGLSFMEDDGRMYNKITQTVKLDQWTSIKSSRNS
jgi:hypothetical protein